VTVEESSQRSRGFVFLSLGTAVAKAAGQSELRVHENGPGALNLPLTAAQRGSMNTRAARPETLQLMSQLISRLTQESFEIKNPAFWSTKAEMCAAAPSRFHDVMKMSVTCDGGLTRRAKTPLCGTCTSCLLRRQALLSSGLREIDRADLERMVGDGLSARRANASPMVLAMLQQIRQVDRAVHDDEPWAALLDRYPELGGVRRSLSARPEQIVDLLDRYSGEWARLNYAIVKEFMSQPKAGS
jgi:hypothetical protein